MKMKKLTARQEAALKRHKVHHTAKHMSEMRKSMRAGKTFKVNESRGNQGKKKTRKKTRRR
jgi:hypothetical protein